MSDLAEHDGFQLIVHWLYTGDIALADEGSDPVTAVNVLVNACRAMDNLYFDWAYQDRFSLRNTIMDHLVDRVINPEKYGEAVTVEDLLEIWRRPYGILSRFVRDWMLYGNLTSKVRPEQLVQLFDSRSKDRFVQMFFEQRLAGNGTPPWEKDPCAYHSHVFESDRCQVRAPAARVLTGKTIESGGQNN
ncbi:hypothetical protein KC318_g6228 [Hortaea werneckii]|nr:hypothetical protein KC334_g5878 [Hortaea werneckii]KAI7011238.1 hypothetical protein KC355_g5845 [Hortaea werneckii]KAI7666899.1 hypothetical protein KC318_g6228 [Hortaea werneckii]